MGGDWILSWLKTGDYEGIDGSGNPSAGVVGVSVEGILLTEAVQIVDAAADCGELTGIGNQIDHMPVSVHRKGKSASYTQAFNPRVHNFMQHMFDAVP